MTRVSYHEAAEDELLRDIAYFEEQALGLGRRFLAAVRQSQNLIAQFPEAAVEIVPDIRKHKVQKFPYSVLYTIEKGSVLILAVAHDRRRPGYWTGRRGQ